MISAVISNQKGYDTAPLTTNKLSYVRNGMVSKAKHLPALFAIGC